MLWQLVANAREALPHGGRLTMIVADPPGEFVTLAVVDDGVGMPAEVLARACDPFFSTRRGVAVGLGLSMAQGFLAQSGGSLVLDSTPGSGTTVTLRLPRRVRRGAAADPADRPLRPTLLVVEDDAMVRGVVQRMAEHIGFGVVAVESAEAALAQLSRALPDAVLIDVMLSPRLDGVALARRIEARHPGLPVLVTSGYAEGQFDLAALASRLPFLPKPFSGDQLRAALLALLAVVRR